MPKFADVDAYIASFPKATQVQLKAIRRAVLGAVPDAEESISYGIPYYKFHGRLLYFAAFKDHYSLFGVRRGMYKAFDKELAKYGGTLKGTIHFPIDKPVPLRLIARIAKFRAAENAAKARKT